MGFRVSDIKNLKFENLHWETDTIELEQFKTGRKIILPLLADVGNAILEYAQYGRPQSDSPHVFLPWKQWSKHKWMSVQLINKIIADAFVEADIEVEMRRHGPHAIRHTLASRLLENHNPLPVISEVLGHSSSESTRYYMRVDINSLRQCVLDVPQVSEEFYQQKGGFFYEQCV